MELTENEFAMLLTFLNTSATEGKYYTREYAEVYEGDMDDFVVGHTFIDGDRIYLVMHVR